MFKFEIYPIGTSWIAKYTFQTLHRPVMVRTFDHFAKEDAELVSRQYVLRYLRREYNDYLFTARHIVDKANVKAVKSIILIERFVPWAKTAELPEVLKHWDTMHSRFLAIIPDNAKPEVRQWMEKRVKNMVDAIELVKTIMPTEESTSEAAA